MSAEFHALPPRAFPDDAARAEGVAEAPPDGRGVGEADGPPPRGAPPAVVVQILATEHWSLLATRSMLWNELMSRISIHLTISSAALVVLALVGQATGFGPGFWVMAVGLSSALLILGTLTLLRVALGSFEDFRLVVGMNRLRGAYAEIEPAVLDHFVTSARDDFPGVSATYTLGMRRPTFVQAYSSTVFFLACFNAIVAGTLAAVVAFVAGGPTALVATLGSAVLVAYLAVHRWLTRRIFKGMGAAFFHGAYGSDGS
ncbi:hypothetical protein [Sinomonas sp. ASV322]|uniref:hypothetical protein n=1 Tax=Sinomonas sp. ASV322 TaxID=3041920 RepID=UPI0027DB3A13|nr:hypothetical protein [Sinomonas sp. ASV322]MDQ4501701.1 hypothetical protein [Sinomonas sp. ASV322]